MATKPELARLIVAPSNTDAEMLYATRIFIGDPFIFLQQNGKRTLGLSDLEIDRAKKNAKADEFVMFSQLEREVQGKAKKAPPYEKVLAHFLRKRGVKRAKVPANFPLGFANELKRKGIALETSNGLVWPARARQRTTAEALGGGQGGPGVGLETNQSGRGRNEYSQGDHRTIRSAGLPNGSA